VIMNTKILQKCVDALGAQSPDLSYVRGMLETLIEMDGATVQVPKSETVQPVTSPVIQNNYVGDPIPPGFKDFVDASLTTE